MGNLLVNGDYKNELGKPGKERSIEKISNNKLKLLVQQN